MPPPVDCGIAIMDGRCWRESATGVEAGGRRSEVNLLGNIQGVVHLNSEISDGAFQLGVSEEKLDCTQVAGLPINLCRLRSAHGVRPVSRTVETGAVDPPMDDASILSRRKVRLPPKPTWE